MNNGFCFTAFLVRCLFLHGHTLQVFHLCFVPVLFSFIIFVVSLRVLDCLLFPCCLSVPLYLQIIINPIRQNMNRNAYAFCLISLRLSFPSRSSSSSSTFDFLETDGCKPVHLSALSFFFIVFISSL
jgi:hypothetical protein